MILIGADFVPTASNIDLFVSGDSSKLFGDKLNALLSKADYRIFNLEVPLSDEEHPINKAGKNFVAPVKCVNGYKSAGADLLTLANNHILDQGEYGLNSTFDVLRKNNIGCVGAGSVPKEASAPYFFVYLGKKIGVYACAEHEFSIVNNSRGGANPFDPLESLDHIVKLKKQSDYVIVLYHGGKEYFRYPSPQLQKTCRKLIEKGADLVVCQHSHCIGCEEKYGGGTIVYGQGNFLFDNSSHEAWQTSMLVGIDEDFKVIYYPLVKSGNGVRLADDEDKEKIINGFEFRSRQITAPGFVEENFAEFANGMLNRYLRCFRGKISLPFRALNKLLGYRLNGLIIRRFGRSELTEIKNYLECEAIRETITEGINKRENCFYGNGE